MAARFSTTVLWLTILVAFVALRIDTSTRTYFQIDDQIVVWAVDDAVNNNHWQPDWYRLGEQAAHQKNITASVVREEPQHDHHYNFSGHMLLSATTIKPLRLLGITTPTIVLLHHIALFWDVISLLCIVLTARALGSKPLALCCAMLYTVFPLAVQGSHYARPDALLTAMGSLLLWLAITQTRWKHRTWLLINGAVLGIATAGKASQLMLGIIPAIAYCTPLLEQKYRHRNTIVHIIVSGTVLLLMTLLILQMMFFIGDMRAEDFWLSVRSIQQYYQHPTPPDLLEHYSYFLQLKNIASYFYSTLGWPLLLAMMVGIASLFLQKQIRYLLILALPLLFFIAYFASIPAFFDRSFCGISSVIVLLIGIGLVTLAQLISSRISIAILVTLAACWTPIRIQYPLQTDLLRSHHNDQRLAFQKQLKDQWAMQTGKDIWIKSIDRRDIFSQMIPAIPEGATRIFVVEDLNDYNSQLYLQKLRDHDFVQIAVYNGHFSDMPTNSLIVVHEAARFYYFMKTP